MLQEDNILGKVFDGTRFSVVGGPETGNGYEWLRVRLEGWSAYNWLSPDPATGVTVAVKETGNLGLRVRDKPGLDAEILGKVYDGTRLLVLEGPIAAGSYQWWKVKLEGWSASDYLREPVGQKEVSPEPATGDAKLSVEELSNRIDRWQRVLASHVQQKTQQMTEGTLPASKGLGFTIVRMLAPNIIERSDQFFFLSQDYDLLTIKSLGFAKTFLKQGDSTLSAEFLDRSYRYLRLSYMMEEASIEQLMAATDISQDLVIMMAAQTALSAAIGPLGLGGLGLPASVHVPATVGLNIFDFYIGYSVDTAIKEMPVEEAAKRQLTTFLVKQLFNLPSVRDAIGQPITKFVGGESGLYQSLERTMFSPAASREITRAIAVAAETGVIEAGKVDATWLANRIVTQLEEAITTN